MKEAERDAIYEKVDLRRLTGQRVPARVNSSVRVDCPVHGGKNDLAIFKDHAFCFSVACGWSGGPFDTAAILLGYYSKTDVLWPNKHFNDIMNKLKALAVEEYTPEPEPEPPTETELLEVVKRYCPTQGEPLRELYKIDRWRGWPDGTAYSRMLGLTKHSIVIPVFNSKGKLLTLRYRVRPSFEDPDKPKYWGTVGLNDQNILYGGYTMPPNKGRVVLLVEGEFDTISSQLAGVPTLNFINGAGWKEGRAEVLQALHKRFKTIVIAYDQDEGGNRGVYGYTTNRGNKVPGLLNNKEWFVDVSKNSVRNLSWNARLGKDPNEFIKRNGTQAWRNLILKAL